MKEAIPRKNKHIKLNGIYRLSFILLCCLLCSQAAMAQSVRVSGYVLDRGEKPIPFAGVKVRGTGTGATTNLKGYYECRMKAATDSITIEFSSMGYQGVSRSFPSLTKDTRLNVRLAEAEMELSSVTVQATKRRLNTMERVNTRDLRVNAGPAGGVESLISTYAGVTQNNELSSQYSVRGGSYDENMVYVNGVEVYRPLLVRSAQQEGLSFVNPDLTQSVQFSAGGFTADYGDKMSSVLDIRYKQPQEKEGAVLLGMLQSSAYYGSSAGAFSQITGVRYKSAKSLLGTTDTKAEYDPNYADGQTFMTYRFSPKLSVSFLGNISQTRYKFVPQTRETSFGTLSDAKKLKIFFDGQEQDRFLTCFGAFSMNFVPDDKQRHAVTLSAFNSNERETYDIQGEYFLNDVQLGADGIASMASGSENSNGLGIGRNHEHARNRLSYRVLNIGYRGEIKLNEKHRLQAGISAQMEKIADHISEWERRDSVGYNLPHSETVLLMYNNLYADTQMKGTRLSAFVQDRFNFSMGGGTFSLIPGIRASWWSFNKELLVSPRISMGYSPESTPALVLRAAAGLYYQAPFYKELRQTHKDAEGNNVVVLNEKIRSQGAFHILAGADYTFEMGGRKYKFTAEAYYKSLFNINPYIIENVKIRYLGENIGSGYAAGIDLKLFGELVPGVDSWLTASIIKARQKLDGYGSLPLMNAPTYNFSFFLQEYVPGNKRITATLRAALSGGLPQLNPSKGLSSPAFTAPAYKRVDLGVMYKWLDPDDSFAGRSKWLMGVKGAYIGADLFNLFDMTNVNSYYWVSDAYQQQYAVPNYLTRRQFNLRLLVEF